MLVYCVIFTILLLSVAASAVHAGFSIKDGAQLESKKNEVDSSAIQNDNSKRKLRQVFLEDSEWIQASSLGDCYRVTSSSDGNKLAAIGNSVGYGGYIWTSHNGGMNWFQTAAPFTFWTDITSSYDGTKLAAISDSVGTYTSSDSGVSWTNTSAPSLYSNSIVSSSDGTKLYVAVNSVGIYTSSDSGVSWTITSAPPDTWQSITSSSDGTKLAAATSEQGGIWTSSNSGVNWIQTAVSLANWSAITSSSDGTKLFAVSAGDYGGYVWISFDSGLSWNQTLLHRGNWACVACSSDGTKVAVGEYGGYIWTSSDSGLTWNNDSILGNWTSIASSSDGNKLAAVDSDYASAGSCSIWTRYVYVNTTQDNNLDLGFVIGVILGGFFFLLICLLVYVYKETIHESLLALVSEKAPTLQDYPTTDLPYRECDLYCVE